MEDMITREQLIDAVSQLNMDLQLGVNAEDIAAIIFTVANDDEAEEIKGVN